MTDPLPISNDNAEVMAAAALARSRAAAAAIRAGVLHNLKPLDRTGPQRLLDRIDRRRIFDEETLVEIDVLTDRIARLVEAGTTSIDIIDNDECNVTPGRWTEYHRSQSADELAGALMALHDLQAALLAVHDMMHAERAIETMRLA